MVSCHADTCGLHSKMTSTRATAWKNVPTGRVRTKEVKIPTHRLMGRPRDVLLHAVMRSS
ncbi:uncharacterized protein N7518_007759 [Penicillium psychrosexuale]|uniref:uncharacterized protein n=1 Tax=Penicillium psychrosexuale TaxID=1002107 RepID=UPI00254520AF|nr:uncharacterized protein N7518_007759 [Penicillium psychrosexuale]KAJ5790748.1 hypothetical protein N7518_007759 [Penicillium psychrosexuale]